MPQVSVITACAAAHLPFLTEAQTSLEEQSCDWEWLIHVDGGEADAVPPILIEDERVRILADPVARGVAIARNRLLAEAAAPWVATLDADDRYCPNGLDTLLALADEHPHCGWVNGRLLLWFAEEGKTQVPEQPAIMPPGLLLPGSMERRWRDQGWHGLNCQVTLWNSDKLLAVGGWSALSGAEDNDAMLAVNALWPCFHSDKRVLLYRQHDNQITRSEHFSEQRLRHRRFSHRRQLAIRRLLGEEIPASDLEVPQPRSSHLGRAD